MTIWLRYFQKHLNINHFQGAFWRAPFKSCSAQPAECNVGLRGLPAFAGEPPRPNIRSASSSQGYHCARRRGDSSSLRSSE